MSFDELDAAIRNGPSGPKIGAFSDYTDPGRDLDEKEFFDRCLRLEEVVAAAPDRQGGIHLARNVRRCTEMACHHGLLDRKSTDIREKRHEIVRQLDKWQKAVAYRRSYVPGVGQHCGGNQPGRIPFGT